MTVESIEIVFVVTLIDHLLVLDDDSHRRVRVKETRFETVESESFDWVESAVSVRRSGIDCEPTPRRDPESVLASESRSGYRQCKVSKKITVLTSRE
jgi:hypothetical protein